MRFKPTVQKHFPKAVGTAGGESTSDVIAVPVDAGYVLEAIINRHSTTLARRLSSHLRVDF